MHWPFKKKLSLPAQKKSSCAGNGRLVDKKPRNANEYQLATNSHKNALIKSSDTLLTHGK